MKKTIQNWEDEVVFDQGKQMKLGPGNKTSLARKEKSLLEFK